MTTSKVVNKILLVLKNKKMLKYHISGNIFGIRISKVYFS